MAGPVLAAVHGGDQMQDIVDHALSIAREQGTELLIGHVVDPTFLSSLKGGSSLPDSSKEVLANIGRRHLEGELERVGGGDVPVKTLIRKGRLFEELVELIEEYGVETLVVGEHKGHFLETHEDYEWDEINEQTGVAFVVVPAADDD